MANGDAAAAKGWHTIAGTNDLRQGYDEVNEALDDIADFTNTGTWPWARVSGKPTTSTLDGKTITVSDSGPSGGVDGDVWLEY